MSHLDHIAKIESSLTPEERELFEERMGIVLENSPNQIGGSKEWYAALEIAAQQIMRLRRDRNPIDLEADLAKEWHLDLLRKQRGKP